MLSSNSNICRNFKNLNNENKLFGCLTYRNFKNLNNQNKMILLFSTENIETLKLYFQTPLTNLFLFYWHKHTVCVCMLYMFMYVYKKYVETKNICMYIG